MTLNITTLSHNGECRLLFVIMLNVMLSVVGAIRWLGAKVQFVNT
jgi:hypothetical protein